MNTIVEIESPKIPKRMQVQSPLAQDTLLMADTIFTDTDGILEESAEDELLNLKLQEAENARRKHDMKQYSSYRALSGSSYDVLNLIKAPSGKCLNKDSTNFLRKSTENIANKRRKSNDYRKSLIDPVSSDTTLIESLRGAKSLEHINKKQENNTEIPETEVGLTSYKKIDSKQQISSRKDSNIEEPKEYSDSNVVPNVNKTFNDSKEKENIRNESFNNDTLKSDAATMTESLTVEEQNVLLPPLYQMKNQRSQEDIINWLHECDGESSNDRDYDSDYSSSYYRTSRSSSVTDISTYSRSTSCQKPTNERGFLDNMIMGPLKGHKNVKKEKSSNERLSNSNSNVQMTSLSTNENSKKYKETNHSVSEEDLLNSNITNGKSPQKSMKGKTSSRSGSVDYIKLEDDAHMSCV